MGMGGNLSDKPDSAVTRPSYLDSCITDILQALSHHSLILHMLERMVRVVAIP